MYYAVSKFEKQSHNNKTIIELACSVRTGKILVSFLFCKSMEPQARSKDLQNKNESNIFPVRTEQASSIASVYYCSFFNILQCFFGAKFSVS